MSTTREPQQPLDSPHGSPTTSPVEDRTPPRGGGKNPGGRRTHLEMPENHLDLVVTPGSIDESRRASKRTALGAVIAMPLFFMVAFTLSYVSASHAPVPHGLALTVAGPEQVTGEVGAAIEERAGAAIDVTTTTDAAAATQAVQDRDAVGAVIIDGDLVTTVVASGGGRLATGAVTSVGQQVADSLGTTATVQDVAPLPADDPSGTVVLFFLVICTVGGFLSITAVTQVFPRVRARWLVLTALGASVLAPLLGFAVISAFVDYEVSFSTAMGAVGVGMIYTFTVSMISVLLNALLGQAAIFAQILIFIAINLPSSGGTTPASMMPPFWQAFHSVWLGSGAFEAIRGILFFDGAQLGRWLLQLAAWTAAATVLTALTVWVSKRRAAGSSEVDPHPDAVEGPDEHPAVGPGRHGAAAASAPSTVSRTAGTASASG